MNKLLKMKSRYLTKILWMNHFQQNENIPLTIRNNAITPLLLLFYRLNRRVRLINHLFNSENTEIKPGG